MAVAIKRNVDYKDRAKGDEVPCLICGKGVKGPWPHALRLVFGGGMAGTAEEAASEPAGDVGAYPVGRSCWKKHPELHEYELK
jgi:hypothetical protein